MQLINELFLEATVGDRESWKVFAEWHDGVGFRKADAEELQWILDNEKISDKSKRALMRSISDKSSRMEDEEGYLRKVGDSSADHMKKIERTENDLKDAAVKIAKIQFFATFVFLAFCLFAALATSWPLAGFVKWVCFGGAVWFASMGCQTLSEMPSIEGKSIMMEDSLVGRALQKRIAEIKVQENALYELNKVIIKAEVAKNKTSE